MIFQNCLKFHSPKREITYNNFEVSLMVFMPNITTKHAITYTNLWFHMWNYKLKLLLTFCMSQCQDGVQVLNVLNTNNATIFSWYQSTELQCSCRVFIFCIKSEIQPFSLKIAVNAIFQFTIVQAASFSIKIELPSNRWYIARVFQIW